MNIDEVERALKIMMKARKAKKMNRAIYNEDETVEAEDKDYSLGHKIWSSDDGSVFFPVSDTYAKLPPDVYEAKVAQSGPFLVRINFSTEDLVLFEDDTIDKVVKEIDRFWKSKSKFEDFGFPYKRGILLYGPAGSGKTCHTKYIIQEVIKMGGVGLKMEHPGVFVQCMRALRKIQPETPVVAIMEDLDAILEQYSESSILNLLDGVDSFENIVYLATTNYPEQLEGRIANRPSRFDRRYHVGYPNPKSRKIYIEHLMSKMKHGDMSRVDIDQWVSDTENFTPAHLKELFISVVLYEDDYKESLKTLKDMRTKISSNEDEFVGQVGFGRSKWE